MLRLPALLLTTGLLAGAAVLGASRWPPEQARAEAPASITAALPATPPASDEAAALPEDVTPPPAAAEPPAPATPPLPASAHISGIRHEYQRLNNCGPVTAGMALSRWGGQLNQYDIAPQLKPNRGDVNVSPPELAAFLRGQGMSVQLAENGSRAMLRTLLAAGYPVVVQTWLITHDGGGMGHYRLLTGYDDAAQTFSALDSYLGPLTLPYARFDELWRAFGRTYLIAAPPEKAAEVEALLDYRADREQTRERALRTALAEADARGDALDWLNVGRAKLALGDARGAARAFDQAFAAAPDRALDPTRPGWVAGGLPWRMGWYSFEPLEAYARTGRYADVLRLTGAVLRSAPAHEEAHYWRGRALAGLNRTAEAKAAYREALRLRPGYAAAREALDRL